MAKYLVFIIIPFEINRKTYDLFAYLMILDQGTTYRKNVNIKNWYSFLNSHIGH